MSGVNTIYLRRNQVMLETLLRGQLMPTLDITSWQQLQHLVRAGMADKVFSERDQLIAKYNNVPTVWDIIGINHDIPTDKKYKYSLTLQPHDCLINIQFSAPQALYYAVEELPAGEHVFTLNGVKYQFETASPVPVGGQVYAHTWETDGYVPTKINTYEEDRVTTIESNISITPIGSGINTLAIVNHHQRCRYGSNNYMNSAIKQWLNSDADTFEWTPMTDYDRKSTSAVYTGAGFLKLLDPELVAVLGAVDKQVGRNTVTDATPTVKQDFFSDKVFLISQVEAYGTDTNAGVSTGEKPYKYYENMAASPTTNAITGRIKLLSNEPRYWWLRSPYVSGANDVRHVNLSGSVSNNGAFDAYGLSPACVII